jgi:hypothetical protein
MSRRIALVSEGALDRIVIEAALNAIFVESFVIVHLQPEPTLPQLGQGWGGVLRWCDKYSSNGVEQLSNHPLLSTFDGIVLHIDADVTRSRYDQLGSINKKPHWRDLPCPRHCPPPEHSVMAIEDVVLSWLGMNSLGSRGVFCVPSKNMDAWMVAALFGGDRQVVGGIECNENPSAVLTARPLADRVMKTKASYSKNVQAVTGSWEKVCEICSRARVFSEDVKRLLVP